MTRHALCSALTFVLLTTASVRASNDCLETGDELIVYRLKTLYRLKNGRLKEQCQLTSRSWLRTIGEPIVLKDCEKEPAIRTLFPVNVIRGPSSISGWVTLPGTVNVTRLRSTLAARKTSFPLPENPDDKVSALMLRQPAELQQAWQDAQSAVAENLRLPANEQSAEPWLVRGEIQSLAGNYHGAMQDFIEAARIIKGGQNDPQTHASAFNAFSKVLEELATAPSPPVAAGHGEEWERGYYAWRRGDFVEAEQAFQNATELAPRSPAYWYFRAITHREIGLTDRALHDARIGAWLENQQAGGNSIYPFSESTSRRLEPVQGPHRQWLERQRHGYQRRISAFPH